MEQNLVNSVYLHYQEGKYICIYKKRITFTNEKHVNIHTSTYIICDHKPKTPFLATT